MMMNATPKQLNEAFVKSLPDDSPVTMLNLMRLRPGVSVEDFSKYTRAIAPLVKKCDGAVLWAGAVEGVAFGELEGGHWDFGALVQYPARAMFLKLTTSQEFADLNVERERYVEHQIILSCRQRFPVR